MAGRPRDRKFLLQPAAWCEAESRKRELLVDLNQTRTLKERKCEKYAPEVRNRRLQTKQQHPNGGRPLERQVTIQVLPRVTGRIFKSRTGHLRPSAGVFEGARETALERYELVLVSTEQTSTPEEPQVRVALTKGTPSDTSTVAAATADIATLHQPADDGCTWSSALWPIAAAVVAVVDVETATLLDECGLPQSSNDAWE
jgi:hypothetical protein